MYWSWMVSLQPPQIAAIIQKDQKFCYPSFFFLRSFLRILVVDGGGFAAEWRRRPPAFLFKEAFAALPSRSAERVSSSHWWVKLPLLPFHFLLRLFIPYLCAFDRQQREGRGRITVMRWWASSLKPFCCTDNKLGGQKKGPCSGICFSVVKISDKTLLNKFEIPTTRK